MMKIRNRILIIPVFQLSIAIFFSLGCNSMSIFGSEKKKANDTGSVIAVDDSFDIEAGTTVEIPINNLIANDVTGNKPPLTVTSVFDAIGGTVTLGVDSVTFTSTGEADEPASFMYTIDNAAGKSADGFVRLTVTRAAQSRLIASNDTWSVYAGKSTTIPGANLTANDIDQTEKPPLTIAEVKNANGGTVTLNQSTGIITFTSTGNPGAGASFVYIVQNADGLTAEATVTITVEEAPSVIANADTFDLIQGQETYIQASALMQNDEGDGNISLVGISDPVGGTVVRTGDTITFVSTGYAYNPAGFSYTIEDELGTTATGSVFINITPLAPIEAYIYDSTDQMAAMRDSYVPPTIQDIFNTWGRFNGNNYYANKAAADAAGDNNAKAWQFLIEPDRVSMPLNVDPYNGFVSNESLENYTLEATFASNDTDNDTIGLVIAFVREGSTNYILSALRTQGGTEPISGWGVTYGTGLSGAKYNQVEWIVAEKSVGGVSNRWNGKKSRVKVVRNGDTIKCYATDWNDEANYQASSEIVIDLASDPRLAKFRAAKPYGYSTFSQPYSTYLDIQFSGGINVNKLYDIESGQVWEYVEGAGWTLKPTTIQQDLGFVRQVTNPETGKTFLVRQNGIELIN